MDFHIILNIIILSIFLRNINFVNDAQEPLKQADAAIGLHKLMITSLGIVLGSSCSYSESLFSKLINHFLVECDVPATMSQNFQKFLSIMVIILGVLIIELSSTVFPFVNCSLETLYSPNWFGSVGLRIEWSRV